MKVARAMLLVAAVAACSNDHDASRQFPLSPSANRSTAVIGNVYTMDNSASGNSVLVFDRAADGSLTPAGSYATGGLGTGAGLGNQSGMVLDESGKTLLAVDAGSNQVTSFRVNGDGSLALASTVGSGGTMPISVTTAGHLVYVLNAGGSGNIVGFTLSSHGALSMIPGSARPLSTGASGPAQIGFDHTGSLLVVSEKATSALSTYTVDHAGLATGPVVTPSSGSTPFGFSFTQHGTLIVSEAAGGSGGTSAVSSYAPAGNGGWSIISGSVDDHQMAACWIVITNSGRFAYTTNAASGTISGFGVQQGALTLLNASGVTGNVGGGTSPIDMTTSRDSKYLYALASGTHAISAFAVGADGSLSSLSGGASGLPVTANGLAAR